MENPIICGKKVQFLVLLKSFCICKNFKSKSKYPKCKTFVAYTKLKCISKIIFNDLWVKNAIYSIAKSILKLLIYRNKAKLDKLELSFINDKIV